MMPPEQEADHRIASTQPPGLAAVANRSGVHAEPSSSEKPVSNSLEPLEKDQRQRPLDRSPILPQSLRPITLKFEDVSYGIKLQSSTKGRTCLGTHNEPKITRSILNGITGVVRPGELLAMLGPSGSGKTTLLTAMAGRLPGKISGSITYNGKPFSSYIKRKMGFVTQDDVLYPHLTVLETLTYAAMLRLPSKLTPKEKIERAEMIIMDLGLVRCRNSLVGGPLIRGISGGERKRVSIGHEMIVNPSLLLLDEPTSGLDSTTAQRIVETLRGLARGGRTVVTTIHQPSSRLYRMFDKVVVLSEGYPIYSGNADRVMEYFGSVGYFPWFNLMNPADFLLDLANGMAPAAKPQLELRERLNQEDDDQSSTRQFLISSYKKNLYPDLKAEIQRNLTQNGLPASDSSGAIGREHQWTTSWWQQFIVLLGRSLKERRYESFSCLRILQVISVSILSGLLWWHSDVSHVQDQVGLLFFFSIFWGFFPMFNAIFAFPHERSMLIKELSSGMYHLSSYYFARTAGDLPMELVLPTIFITVTYWMGGLKPSFSSYSLTLLIILLNVMVSQGLGLAIGAIVMDTKQATTLASVTMLVFLLAGGYYIQHIPSFIAWLKYVSFSQYCYKLLVGVQYSENQVYQCESGLYCKVMDFPAIKHLGPDNKLWDVAALAVMLIGYRILAFVALKMGLPH